MTASPTLPRLYAIPEVADLLRVSIKTVRRWIEQGALITHRFGRQLRISEADLAAVIKRQRQSCSP